MQNSVEAPAKNAATTGANPASLLRLLMPLARAKFLIVLFSLAGFGLGYGLSFTVPKTYTSVVRLLPPQTNSNTATMLLNQVGGATSLGSSALGIKNPADLYAGILRSRAILEPVVQQENLVAAYRVSVPDLAEKHLLKNLKITSGKDGILEIAVRDTDPVRSARIGNAIVESLYKLSRQLTIQEANRRANFHGALVDEARTELNRLDFALLMEERRWGISRIKGHEEQLSGAVGEIEGLIKTKEFQIASMLRYATESNVELRRNRLELRQLRTQLAAIKGNYGQAAHKTPGGLRLAAEHVGSTGLLEGSDRIARMRRDVKLQEIVLENAMRVEAASRVDDQRDLSIIQVLDQAAIPNAKSGPSRTVAAVIGGLTTTVFGILLVLAADVIKSNPKRLQRWHQLRSHLLARPKKFDSKKT